MRYHPVTLKWALRQLIKQGESSYTELAEVLALPSVQYLREFKNAFNSDGEGPQHGLLAEMDAQAKRRGMVGWTRYGVLKWDAMKCSEGVVSNVFTSELIGISWQDLASYEHIALELKAMDADGAADSDAAAAAAPDAAQGAPVQGAPASERSEPPKPKLAKYWSEVFFISCWVTNFTYSIFRAATADLSAHDIVEIVYQSLLACDIHDFEVVCLVCDGASEHRLFQVATRPPRSPPPPLPHQDVNLRLTTIGWRGGAWAAAWGSAREGRGGFHTQVKPRLCPLQASRMSFLIFSSLFPPLARPSSPRIGQCHTRNVSEASRSRALRRCSR